MIINNNYLHTYVITEHGMKDINEVNIGDKVYEYDTGELIEVENIVQSLEPIIRIDFSDGRMDYRVINETIPGNFKIKALEFKGLKDPLYPDPNLVGAIFTYADHSDEYVNLPMDMDQVNNLFSHKYHVKYANKIEKNKVYFANISTPDKILKWEEMFSHYDFYAKNKNVWDKIIPENYVYSSIKDRIQFIMGVFDMGYDFRRFGHNVAISHHNEDMLKVIQKILWSLGILSKIAYIPGWTDNDNQFHYYPYKRFYVLQLLGKDRNYPGLFYEREYIEKIITMEDILDRINRRYILKLINKKKYGESYISNLVFDKPRWFYTENYLPRLSK